MRKTAVVIGFGVFFLVMALLLKFYAYDKLTVIPKDQNTGLSAYDAHAKYFDADKVKFSKGPLTTHIRAVVDQKASEKYGHNVVVFNKWQTSDNNGKKPPMEAFSERIPVDRHTGLPVHCCGESENGKPIKHEGYTIKFPFDTQKTSYKYWDYWAEKAMTMKYQETTKIDGLTVYKFEGDTPRSPYASEPTKEMPGFAFGGAKSSPAVKAKRYFQDHRTIWVEPRTGAFIKVREQIHQTMVDPKSNKTITAVQTDTVFTKKTIQANVDEYAPKAKQLKILGMLPWILGILGIILLLIGGALAFLTGRSGGGGRHDERGDDGGGDGGLGDEIYEGSSV